MNMQDMMVFRDAGSRTVDKYLMSYERHVIAVRRHPAVLLQSAAETLGGLLVSALVHTYTGIPLLWLPWLFLVGRLVWKVITWSIEFFIVTEHRVMMVTGVLNRKVAMMPLAKVEDIKLDRSVVGRMLGYGEFEIESAGDKQALRNVAYMPYPEQLYLEISSMIFGAEDESPD
ncbi:MULTISPECIES: PH domain-containing protein [Thermomonospora]|uniref:Putative membrane protein YdbT with pleckstrin-like domain n=1 Tax=Thermomonospora cellulosilytica TaxID=1411118 RepID=A0A7W3N436_9ACTN|nr:MULTISPECIES: PH domain-containing protein [Thermomonospora]MBA9007072.1 putative membrane protein YdbT with pleckstrin-like domain [Thermomonospora cellulosilytica]